MTAKKQYALRTCKADMTSYNGFKLPSKIGSKVTAPDWDEKAACGNGLHGLLNGNGDATLLDWSDDAKWLVVEIIGKTVDLGGKVKFRSCFVRCIGDRKKATDYIISKGADASKCVGAFLTGGSRSTLTGGSRSTLNWLIWDGTYHRMHTFYVGENGINANTKYNFKYGKIVEVK